MIKIDDYKLNDDEEDTILFALYHYQLQWEKLKNSNSRYLNKKSCVELQKQIGLLIDKITERY